MAAPGAVAADWRQFRHFLTADALRTFKIERMANWTINPRLRTVTAHVADMSLRSPDENRGGDKRNRQQGIHHCDCVRGTPSSYQSSTVRVWSTRGVCGWPSTVID
uniref:Uncharacterized protein n=1 Tax=Meloidogyne floridensis TaxID=298350 RepID=A0A915NRY2_9BILA